MSSTLIDTEAFSDILRRKSIRLDDREILIANLHNSSQLADLSAPGNSEGLGRVRHFRRLTDEGWPLNPLPIDPATHKLDLPRSDDMEAQVFQNAACNWRCWYCYVPYKLLGGSQSTGTWTSPEKLVLSYLDLPDRPKILDLSGGQPDLTPEWILWTMEALQKAGASSTTYLWSDDNLSNDYFHKYLSAKQIKYISEYPNYGKVGCFKGFDTRSFSFNTKAEPQLFERQFSIFAQLIGTGIDTYGYATFTTDADDRIPEKVSLFVDRLQSISRLLPLRIVPLRVKRFTPAIEEGRITPLHERAMRLQDDAVECWQQELTKRFTSTELALPIYAVEV
jgi:uncharacterized Fe-S cluster-containing radical SAM superfamily protein